MTRSPLRDTWLFLAEPQSWLVNSDISTPELSTFSWQSSKTRMPSRHRS